MNSAKKLPKSPLPAMNKINCSLLPFGVFKKRPPERSDSDECIGCSPLAIQGRAVHYVLRVPNRQEAMHFFRDVLGMKVLRHEEFASGCGPACKGFCGTLWSKTMVGYGPEDKFFAFELAYSYNKEEYASGNALCSVTIKSSSVLRQASKAKWPIRDGNVLIGPGGHQFVIVEEQTAKNGDPVQKVTLGSRNMKKTVKYWNGVLGINICSLDHNKKTCGFCFKENATVIEFQEMEGEIKHADSFGRLSFACPLQQLSKIERTVICLKHTIISPLTTVRANGKELYHVIVMADPDDHEVCFYDEASYRKLSKFNPEASAVFDRYVKLESGSTADTVSQLKSGQTGSVQGKDAETASAPPTAVVSIGNDEPGDSMKPAEVESKRSEPAGGAPSEQTADKASSAVPESASVHTGPIKEEEANSQITPIVVEEPIPEEAPTEKPDSVAAAGEAADIPKETPTVEPKGASAPKDEDATPSGEPQGEPTPKNEDEPEEASAPKDDGKTPDAAPEDASVSKDDDKTPDAAPEDASVSKDDGKTPDAAPEDASAAKDDAETPDAKPEDASASKGDDASASKGDDASAAKDGDETSKDEDEEVSPKKIQSENFTAPQQEAPKRTELGQPQKVRPKVVNTEWNQTSMGVAPPSVAALNKVPSETKSKQDPETSSLR